MWWWIRAFQQTTLTWASAQHNHNIRVYMQKALFGWLCINNFNDVLRVKIQDATETVHTLFMPFM